MPYQLPISPVQKYQINDDVCQVMSSFAICAVGVPTALTPVVAGKRNRVMGWIIQTNNAAAGNVNLISSGGLVLCTFVAPTNAQPSDKLPITDSGYMESVTGESISMNAGAQPLLVTLFYVTYIPKP